MDNYTEIERKVKRMMSQNYFTDRRFTEFEDGSKIIFSHKRDILEKYYCFIDGIWYVVKEYDGVCTIKEDKLKQNYSHE